MQSDDDPQLSSPACAMHEANDAYMGYASPDEILDLLSALLAAERAGARVALGSRRQVSDPAIIAFFKQLARDESSCCAMLTRHLTRLGGTVTTEVGEFYQSAMGIVDMNARLAFLNRGQGWVASRIKKILPRIRQDDLYADLKNMLVVHENNIATANKLASTNHPA